MLKKVSTAVWIAILLIVLVGCISYTLESEKSDMITSTEKPAYEVTLSPEVIDSGDITLTAQVVGTNDLSITILNKTSQTLLVGYGDWALKKWNGEAWELVLYKENAPPVTTELCEIASNEAWEEHLSLEANFGSLALGRYMISKKVYFPNESPVLIDGREYTANGEINAEFELFPN